LSETQYRAKSDDTGACPCRGVAEPSIAPALGWQDRLARPTVRQRAVKTDGAAVRARR